MRYFADISYKGTAYHGWQNQPNAISVQEVVERSLSKLLRQPMSVVGAGRTDTGVHASFYVLHFNVASEIADLTTFTYHLNCVLPADIAVSRIYPVADNAHARFDAVSRQYKYYVSLRKDCFRSEFAAQITTDLDVDQMNMAAKLLLEHIDFTTFCKRHSDTKTNICHVNEATWSVDVDVLVFTISADRFLRNMVRAIVGTLLDVGRGKLSVEDFGDIIESRDLSRSSSSAPAQGLFLTDVRYKTPYSSRE